MFYVTNPFPAALSTTSYRRSAPRCFSCTGTAPPLGQAASTVPAAGVGFGEFAAYATRSDTFSVFLSKGET